MKYIKTTRTYIDAVQNQGGDDPQKWSPLCKLINDHCGNMKHYAMAIDNILTIITSKNETLTANLTDWVIIDDHGEIRVLTDLEFNKQYIVDTSHMQEA